LFRSDGDSVRIKYKRLFVAVKDSSTQTDPVITKDVFLQTDWPQANDDSRGLASSCNIIAKRYELLKKKVRLLGSYRGDLSST
jgi:hypothetical protein